MVYAIRPSLKFYEHIFEYHFYSFLIENPLFYQCRFANDICREPFLDDNREGIRRLDEGAFLFLVDLVTFIRDAYGKMHDVITKNIEKIRKPRTSNADSLSNWIQKREVKLPKTKNPEGRNSIFIDDCQPVKFPRKYKTNLKIVLCFTPAK